MLTPDVIVPDPANPQSYNRYSYSYNNPINLVDPSGHGPIDDWIVEQAINAPDEWKPGIRSFSERSLNRIDWWYSKPDDCGCEGSAGFVDPALARSSSPKGL